MGLLDIFSKTPAAPTKVERLPSGSFTMDSTGHIVASTLPHSFPPARMKEVGQLMISLFSTAAQQGMPLREAAVQYAGLKLTAREARGGVIVFLAPRS